MRPTDRGRLYKGLRTRTQTFGAICAPLFYGGIPLNETKQNVQAAPAAEAAAPRQENKMGIMPVNKLLISMSLPMMASMLVQALYNVVDSI